MEGQVIGTPAYMSPEQALGKPVDHRSDLFSFGVVLYQLATNSSPFAGASFGDTVNKVINLQPPPMSDYIRGVSAELERITRKCMEKDPEHRYQTPRELLVDLENLKRDGETECAMAKRRFSHVNQARATWALRLVLIATVALVTGSFIWRGFYHPQQQADDDSRRAPRSSSTAALDKHRLAVLPLDNISRDPADAYFADGMTEELISRLSKLSGLIVIGRTSVMKYRDAEKNVPEIGRALQVGTLLDGSVRKAGDQLRISVQLIDVESQESVWSQDFDRELKDVFAIQGEVSEQVARALHGQLLSSEQLLLAKQPTANLDAWKLYVEGRISWSKRTAADMDKAIKFLNAAIQLDTKFPEAHAGLASCYALFPLYSRRPAETHMEKARSAAREALRLDTTLAEAQAVLAYIAAFYDYDWEGAEAAFQQALELDPKHPTTHHWYSLHLSQLGRSERALEEIEQARELDPKSMIINHTVGLTQYLAGNNQRSIDEYRNTLKLDFNFPTTHSFLGLAHLQTGESQEAIREFELARAQLGGTPFYLGMLGHAYAVAGETAKSEEVLAELKTYFHELSVAYDIAMIHQGLGNQEEAFRSLAEAATQKDWWMAFVKVDPIWENLRTDLRFRKLLIDMNLEEEWHLQ